MNHCVNVQRIVFKLLCTRLTIIKATLAIHDNKPYYKCSSCFLPAHRRHKFDTASTLQEKLRYKKDEKQHDVILELAFTFIYTCAATCSILVNTKNDDVTRAVIGQYNPTRLSRSGCSEHRQSPTALYYRIVR